MARTRKLNRDLKYGRKNDRFSQAQGWESPILMPANLRDPLEPVMSDDAFFERYQGLENAMNDVMEKYDEYKTGINVWGTEYPGFDPFQFLAHFVLSKDKKEVMDYYKELSGAKFLLENGINPEMFKPMGERGAAGRYKIGSVFRPEDGLVDPKALFLTQTTLQYNPMSNARMEKFNLPGSIPRTASLRHLKQQLETVRQEGPEFLAGKKVTVFDLETPGLLKDQGFWQMAFQTMDEAGKLTEKNIYVKNPWMQNMGVIRDPRTGLPKTLQEALAPDATDFKQGLKEFLDVAEGSDIIAGHNIPFDLRMLMASARSHPDIRQDPDLLARVERFGAGLVNPQTGEISQKVFDTAAWARALYHSTLSDVGLSKMERGQKFNLLNLITNTDLMERFTPEEAKAFLEYGLHGAQIDVPITMKLLQALVEAGTGGPGLDVNKHLPADLAALARSSRAFGPAIRIADAKYIDAALLRRRGVLDAMGRPLISPLEQKVLLERRLGAELPYTFKEPSIREIFADKTRGSLFTRARQALWDTPDQAANAELLGYNAGLWSKYTNKFIHRGRMNIDLAENAMTPVQQAMMQERFRKIGAPFSGLTWMERHIGTLLATNSRAVSEEAKTVRDIYGSTTLAGEFVPATKFGVVGQKQVVLMPEEALEDILRAGLKKGLFQGPGRAAVNKNALLYQLDPFHHGQGKAKSEIGFKYRFGTQAEKEQQFIIQHLTEALATEGHPFQEMGLTQDVLSDISRAFALGPDAYGMQIGTFTGMKDSATAERVIGELNKLMGREVIGTEDVVAGHVVSAGRGKFGGFVLGAPETMTSEELTSLKAGAAKASELHDLIVSTSNNRMNSIAKTILFRGKAGEDLGAAYNIYNAAMNWRKRAPLIGLAALATGGGYYMHRRHRRKAQIEQTLALQPLEPPGAITPPPSQTGMGRQSVNQTGGLMKLLDQNKIRHMIMGPTRYQYLYKNVGT